MKKQRAVPCTSQWTHPSDTACARTRTWQMLPLAKRVIENLYVVSIPGCPLNSERGCWILHFADRICWLLFLICILQIDFGLRTFDLHLEFCRSIQLTVRFPIDLTSRSIFIFDANATPYTSVCWVCGFDLHFQFLICICRSIACVVFDLHLQIDSFRVQIDLLTPQFWFAFCRSIQLTMSFPIDFAKQIDFYFWRMPLHKRILSLTFLQL